jgi:8-oxo-dGTP diphosphatase
MDLESYQQEIKGKAVTFRHLGAKVVPFERVTSVSVIPFNKNGELVVVNLRHRGLDLPGGHVEPGEKTPEETARREVMEEACMTVRDLVLVETIQSDFFQEPSYMLLYAAYADDLQEFVPSREASERLIVAPDAFIERYEAGNKVLMEQAVTRAWELVKE